MPEHEELTVGIRELKARASELLRELDGKGREIVITRRGKPCARLIPFRSPKSSTPAGKRILRNAFPDLPELTEEDFAEIKRMWHPRDEAL